MEQNERLARWAGLKQHKKSMVWVPPEYAVEDFRAFGITLPDFRYDETACFKWLVPRLQPAGYELEIVCDSELNSWRVSLISITRTCSIASPCVWYDKPEETAQALCDAIDKIIKEG